jgi:two-component system sensor histidine kinase KdpD
MPTFPDESRPDPDALLAQVQAQEARQSRGKLKIFFGGSAGVGKTYAMLSAARAKSAEGVDVVVGYAEPHNRPETEMLLLGLDLLPNRIVEYRGTQLRELDVDAALKRRPELLLVDELAHTNAPGSRHAKRWQDVDELLAAGINVYTTLNVQHLESLNDVIAQITGVTVRETLPDAMFEKADEVELVDLSPDQLLERLREGKVYVPRQAEQALKGFFQKSNLTALRELSLRRTADRVNEQVQSARREQFARTTWPTSERLLVCVGPAPSSAKVIRATKRLAVALHAEWIAVHVETPRFKQSGGQARDALLRHFRLAERLGAQTVTLGGFDAAEEIINYARQRNASKIVVGKTSLPRWRERLRGSLVDELVRRSGDIDVYVIRGIAPADTDADKTSPGIAQAPSPISRSSMAWAFIAPTACAIGSALLQQIQPGFAPANVAMLFLVGVILVATKHGRGPSVVAAVLSVLAFDFVFVPPHWTFAVTDTQYLFTFLVMLGVGLLISMLTARIRDQATASRQREQHTSALYRMTEQLASTTGIANLTATAVQHIGDVFQGHVVLMLPHGDRRLVVAATNDPRLGRETSELAVAQWVFENRQMAGRGTDTLPASQSLYLPLVATRGAVGVLGLQNAQTHQLLAPRQRQLLDAFVNQIAIAVERDHLAQEARRAQVQAEAESLRNSLLSSVSHDLRTPLAVITGASSGLLESGHLTDPGQRDLVKTIHDESNRLTHLVGNLLDITRLESGTVRINRQWHPLEEIVGSALHRLEPVLAGRPISTALPADLPLVPVDGVLIEQVLFNLLENAAKYTPSGTPIDIRAEGDPHKVTVTVADHGPGLAAGEESNVFAKFVRGANAGHQRGVGLGLAICKAIIEAHGGRIWAEKHPANAGAVFRFTLPINGTPPPSEPPATMSRVSS